MPAVAEIFSTPDYLPHRVSIVEESTEFVRTDRAKLRAATFLDGRTDFSSGPSAGTSIDALLAQTIDVSSPDRFIFHVGFCGSTLLSRLLDGEGRAVVLREPNCLVDLAAYQAALDHKDMRDGRRDAILLSLCALLRRRWAPTEAVVIKPSSWINNIAPLLCRISPGIRPLFLTMSRAAFIHAIFRGGTARLNFAARAAVHLSSAGSENAKLVASALASTTEPLRQLALLAVVTHEIQMRLFREAERVGGWGLPHRLTFEEIVTDPLKASIKAAAALELELDEGALEKRCSHWLGRHAKQPDASFSIGDEADADVRVMAEFGDHIDMALRWADREIGPSPATELFLDRP